MKKYKNHMAATIGENLVVAEMSRRGIIATNFAGNLPTFDIIAHDPETQKYAKIQVKASNTDNWQTSLNKHFNMTYDEETGKQFIGDWTTDTPEDTIYVMVRLGEKYGEDRFFILYYSDLREMLKRRYQNYLDRHGGARPRKGNSMHSKWDLKQLEPFEDNWSIIKKES